MQLLSFEDLFIFDLANNHQGDVRHGENIIQAVGQVCNKHNIRGALKFQFRQLDTFIHPDFKNKKDIPHIPRFISTALKKEDYNILIEKVRSQNLLTMCTPFDEESVDIILDSDIDIIKIASCSALDKPLLQKISKANKPVVLSTSGLSMNQLDWIVSFFDSKGLNFALMHCVAIYPTPNNMLKLNQIELLKERFPEMQIGFSTHESPENYSAIKIAYAKGARIFERHVGIETDKYKLNAYSANPQQIDKWIEAYKEVKSACGGDERSPAHPDELKSLQSLMRGVYAKTDIAKGKIIKREDIFFAMPLQDNQLNSGNWTDSLIADKDYFRNSPLNSGISKHFTTKDDLIYQLMLQIKGMLNNAGIFVNRDSSIEISHHYGLDRFREFGAVIINCINRSYCKKIIVQLPRQKHPYHYHDKKEETFQLLNGDMEIETEGIRTSLKPGDTYLVKPREWHKFHTLDGAIIEEVSTTHYNNDSFYEDPLISQLSRGERKTNVDSWSRILKWKY
jgi:sialic acid synthase SpsE/mannose-6-phosphate isomerase-like protein (cupin superfamily)